METTRTQIVSVLRGIGRDKLAEMTLARQPDVIIVKPKLLTVGEQGKINKPFIFTIDHRDRNDAKVVEKHTAEMKERGLEAVRSDRPDSGIELVSDDVAREVNLSPLFQAVALTHHYVITEIFWQDYYKRRPGQEAMDPQDIGRAIVSIKFQKAGPAVVPIEVSDRVYDRIMSWLRKSTFGNLHVWANLRETPTGIIRLDTVNCNCEHPKRVAHHAVETRQMKNELHMTVENGRWSYKVAKI